MRKYSQVKALMAVTLASLRAIFRSPQSVLFGVFFPVILIVIFGAVGNCGGVSIDVGMENNSDTTSPIYYIIKSNPILNVVDKGQDTLLDMLKKGKLTALISIHKINATDSHEHFEVHLKSTSASRRELPALQSVLRDIINGMDRKENDSYYSAASISSEIIPGREFKMIDFFLPGMIGFSLIGSAVFGVAFLFYNLRDTLVLKRLYASPIYKRNIILGETIGRVIFQIVTVVVLILFGTLFYHFTLAKGFITFIDMIIVSVLGLVVFMGAGFIVSGVAKNQNVIPIYANLFMFPQYFLSGTFFPKTALPKGIQWMIDLLPLTALNDALRKISFEGASLIQCWRESLLLIVWGIIVYVIAVKVFRWE